MNKEEQMLQKRLIELSKIAYTKGIVVFSDFLNLNDLNILHITPKNMFYSQFKTFGGYELSERQIAAFLPDALYYDYQYPIDVIEISPVNSKFSEALTHRDYLGAIMNLGIERFKLGDILTDRDRAFLFVKKELSGYIMDNLTRIRHTVIRASLSSCTEFSYSPSFEVIKGTVASIRLDSILSLAYPLSRNKMTAFIENGFVYVNGKLITSNGFRLQNGDIISVRKMGRIIYDGIISETKKNRYMISVRKFC